MYETGALASVEMTHGPESVSDARPLSCYNRSAHRAAYEFRLTGEVAEWLKAAVC